jgi:hypothetical protein
MFEDTANKMVISWYTVYTYLRYLVERRISPVDHSTYLIPLREISSDLTPSFTYSSSSLNSVTDMLSCSRYGDKGGHDCAVNLKMMMLYQTILLSLSHAGRS